MTRVATVAEAPRSMVSGVWGAGAGGAARTGHGSGDHGRVLCSDIRTALSARVDGEALPPGVSGPALDAHLRGCAECQLWERRVRALREWTTRIGDTAY
ncbi:zf-HC2 domain-containing protein [Streptomyces sp. NPDC057702]|uniref:zf-HC2 domain-containing protein n=1 Tax=unclassified Streptomyces TaxID=2593676 RepID=UPI00369DB973